VARRARRRRSGPARRSQAHEPPHDRPGPAAERLLFRSFHVDRAPLDLRAGNMDLYLFGLRTDAAIDLRGDADVQLFEAPATTLSLVLNPAPAPGGRLNPFSLPEVRRAVQYLVDREFIAQDLFRGMAMPMVSHVSPLDYDYLTVYEVDRGAGIRFDPEYARSLIDDGDDRAPARSASTGRWHYGGQPIRLALHRAGSRTSGARSATWFAPSWSAPASTSRCRTRTSRRRCWRCTPPIPRPSSGTSTPRAGAGARRSATTSAPSTP
jgi:hypothetical protein